MTTPFLSVTNDHGKGNKMGRKNKRIVEDTFLPPIKEEWRSVPRCSRFPDKTVFTTGYRAQIAVDEISASSHRDKVPERVYECLLEEGGCGFFHITSQREYQERAYATVPVPTNPRTADANSEQY